MRISLLVASRAPTKTDAWVQPCVAQIDGQVDEKDDAAGEEDESLDRRVVARGDRIDEVLSDARPGEDRLDDDRSAQERRQPDAGDGDDRAERVPQDVAADDDPLAQALGARRTHVVV